MSRLLALTAMMATVLVFSPSAFAQRGGSHGIWKPHYSNPGPGGSYPGRSYSFVQPYPGPTSVAPAPAYQRFSFEPLGIAAGDKVVVTGDNIQLMLGNAVVGAAPKGLEFNVTKVRNGWLGAVVTIDGKEYRGWIFNRNVRLVE